MLKTDRLSELINETKLFESVPQPGFQYKVISGAVSEYKILYVLNLLKSRKNIFYVCQNDYEAKSSFSSFRKYFDENTVYLYPREQLYFTRTDSYSREISNERMRAVNALLRPEGCIVITSIWALCEKRPFFDRTSDNIYKTGDTIDRDSLAEMLAGMGYERTERTEAAGQFSIRGGIIDIFTGVSENPVRIELFGDEIESIRVFSAATQLSEGSTDSFELFPYSEILLSSEERVLALSRMKTESEEISAKTSDENLKKEFAENMNEINELMTRSPEELDRLLFMYTDRQLRSAADIPDNAVFILNEPSRLKEGFEAMRRSVSNDFSSLLESGAVLPGQQHIFFDYMSIVKRIKKSEHAGFCAVSSKCEEFIPVSEYNAACLEIMDYRRSINAFFSLLPRYIQDGYKCIFLYESEEQKEALRNLFEAYSHALSAVSSGKAALFEAKLHSGFETAEKKILLVPGSSLLSTKPPAESSRLLKRTKKEDYFSDISSGDYVVHDVHGIGIYAGIERIVLEGVSKDYIKILYAKEDVLYIPAEQMDLLQKYVGAEQSKPRVSRLGTSEWQNTKEKARGAVRELADEYLRMYAERVQVKGYAFGEDTVWQREFEEKFEYELTDDQAQSCEEIKKDMQSEGPMDRLLIGDVGYGKTEVALRCAFKAVMEGKQTAVLVPTTILALQHYNNFADRFSGYPVRIEMLSRLRTASQIKQSLKNIVSGAADIVIGTHRLLSADVVFKDLGLLVVDEEQRFGVAHKDKLKLIKKNVDTLTLSATPIPRTLHMSLAGIKDMSVIDTPPKNRIPVQTFVMPYDNIIIKEAVLSELSRGGQVFYLHNRVSSIEDTAVSLREQMPGIKVAAAHGQMPQRELESIIMSFMRGEIDVLVSTSIIENGVDFVNANTIIIENADHLGLSQLYQLRGRVGRSGVQAYAYMTYSKSRTLSEDASKRLQSIKEFTKFGSGFKVAMRDLQIRGAGNILGSRQHGHFQNVGYEMYYRMLQEAVGEHFGTEYEKKQETEIDLLADAYLPQSYISGESERIEIYKKIAAIASEEEKQQLLRELEDRFSKPPAPAAALLEAAWCRALAQKCGFAKVKQNKDVIQFTFNDSEEFDFDRLNSLRSIYSIKVRTSEEKAVMNVKLKKNENVISFCSELLLKLL